MPTLRPRLAVWPTAVAPMVLATLMAGPGPALAAPKPEDLLKGTMIISDRPLPTRWTNASAYAAQLRSMNRGSIFYDKKTGKAQVYYGAFFAQPVNDVQVNFVIYDITSGYAAKVKKGSWEAFMGRKGERVLFNSVELDKEDLEMNRKYLFAIESNHRIIAKGEVILRGEAPRYSGKVEFTEEEARAR
ncbi:MAG: hypothetical protein RMK29_02610 [Myxococcales bacterium]|nr:hypothetical protein [Myxococcota bacterium]MDW8280573.1 hypothetical protein [Myxococcales bacterium]